MKATPLKFARLESGTLQVDLARRAKINLSRLSLLENDHVAAKADELERLSQALGVPIERLRPLGAVS